MTVCPASFCIAGVEIVELLSTLSDRTSNTLDHHARGRDGSGAKCSARHAFHSVGRLLHHRFFSHDHPSQGGKFNKRGAAWFHRTRDIMGFTAAGRL